MNNRDAIRYHRAFSRQQQQYEKAAAKVFYAAIRDQIKQFLDAARDYPSGMERQAVNEIHPLTMAKAYKRVAIKVGIGFSRVTEAEMTAIIAGEQPKKSAYPDYDTKAANPNDRAMIETYLRLFGAKKVVGVTETTRKWIAEQIVSGQQSGLTYDQVAKGLLTDEINAKRAIRIARTETVGMMNLGRYLAANKSNFQWEKVWVDAHDDKVRPGITSEDSPFDHHASDIKVATKLNMLFRVSGEYLMFPGDSAHGASAGNIISCRCSFALQPKRDDHGRLMVKPKPMTVDVEGMEGFPEGTTSPLPQPVAAPLLEPEPVAEQKPEALPEAIPVPAPRPAGFINLIQALISGAQLGSLLGLTFESLFGLPQNQNQ